MSEYPWNEKNNTFTWLSSLYNPFKYDFICISETNIDSTISSDNNNLNMSGHNLLRANYPSNSKRGGVWIYVCLVCKVSLGNKTGYVVVTYRFPSQTYLEFQKLLTSFDTLLQNLQNLNPHSTMILGDFNARSHWWRSKDILSVEENHIDTLTSMFGLHQVISGPTHILS